MLVEDSMRLGNWQLLANKLIQQIKDALDRLNSNLAREKMVELNTQMQLGNLPDDEHKGLLAGLILRPEWDIDVRAK
jgi:hypothetical protein